MSQSIVLATAGRHATTTTATSRSAWSLWPGQARRVSTATTPGAHGSSLLQKLPRRLALLSQQQQRQQQHQYHSTTLPIRFGLFASPASSFSSRQSLVRCVSTTASTATLNAEPRHAHLLSSSTLPEDSDSNLDSDSDSDSRSNKEDGNEVDDEQELFKTRYRKPVFTPEVDAEIIRLRGQNQTWPTIGSTLGIPHRSCHRRYRSLLDPDLVEKWTDAKVAVMESMVAMGKSWTEIAEQVGITSTGCQIKWRAVTRPKDQVRNRVFDELQSGVLLKLVEEHGEDNWKQVMRGFMLQLGGRDMAKVTPEQLRHQYYRLQRRKTNVWTLDHETALIQHVLKHGAGQWDLIADSLKEHSAEDCREHWASLDMRAKKPKQKAWYRGEQANFWRLWLRFGSDFNLIADQFPRRTQQECEAFFEKTVQDMRGKDQDPEKTNQQIKDYAEKLCQYVAHIWTKEESEQLQAVVERMKASSTQKKRPSVNWSKVADELALGIDSSQCKNHHNYLQTLRNRGLGGIWTEEERVLLEKAVQTHGRNWITISELYFPNRNPKSLCHKYKTVGNPINYVSPGEYFSLMEAVKRQESAFEAAQTNPDMDGDGDSKEDEEESRFKPNWVSIARSMRAKGWTADACRIAYESSFQSHVKHNTWTPEEDELLHQSMKEYGRKNWLLLASRIPGKDSWQCRLRFAELQKPMAAKLAAQREKKMAVGQPDQHVGDSDGNSDEPIPAYTS